MAITNVKFLLDENVPKKVKHLIQSLNYSEVQTLNDIGWLGIKNGELSSRVKKFGFILITRDSDFIFLWEKYSLSVIYLQIKPSNFETMKPRIIDVFSSRIFESRRPFLLTIHNETVRIRYRK